MTTYRFQLIPIGNSFRYYQADYYYAPIAYTADVYKLYKKYDAGEYVTYKVLLLILIVSI